VTLLDVWSATRRPVFTALNRLTVAFAAVLAGHGCAGETVGPLAIVMTEWSIAVVGDGVYSNWYLRADGSRGRDCARALRRWSGDDRRQLRLGSAHHR
jgi:hypothetical protein